MQEFKFTFNVWCIAKNIHDLNIKKDRVFNVASLCNMIHYSPSNPFIRRVFKYLNENEVFIFQEKIGASKVYKIDNKKLSELIENNDIWQEFATYVHKNKIFYADI